MGYKLAGYDVIGCVEIDPKMMAVYKKNHNPKYPYLLGIQDFNKIPDKDLPREFFELDILDGSPPCSTFSMAGSRENKWGKKSHFREGQASQHLDDLFFDFIRTADKLKPKVVVAENVKGLIQGKAKGYVKQIFKGFKDIGYDCQLFLLNAARMGVPQRRERTFFIANRIGKRCSLDFNESLIKVSDVSIQTKKGKHLSTRRFGDVLVNMNRPLSTITGCTRFFTGKETQIQDDSLREFSSFPADYKLFTKYVAGMSVPPFMMQRVATEIYKQMLWGS